MLPRNRIERPANCRFDQQTADRATGFFEGLLRHTEGRWAGQPFHLADWQRRDLAEIFGRVDDDGARVIRTAYISVPKKNGKSELAAGVALKLLFADSEPGAQIYGAASDRDQAGIVYRVAAAMVRSSAALRKRAKIIDSGKRIVLPQANSFYRALTKEVAGKHGWNSHGVIFDEVHAQRDLRLWEVLTFGAGAARRQPLTWAITTAGIPGESPVWEMLHTEADQILRGLAPCPPDFYPVVYGADPDDPWDDEEVWRVANPAIGAGFLDIRSVREEFERARRRPAEQNSFRRLRLNQSVSQEFRWIDMEEWRACGGALDLQALREIPCYAGVDLSSRRDVTALVFVWLIDGIFYFLPYFWVPRDNLDEKRINVEAYKYRAWAEKGLITPTAGDAIDFDSISARIVQLGQELQIRQIAFDPMFASQLAQQLQAQGFTMVEFRQGFRNFTEPCQELEDALADRRIRHGGNPVLDWMADCITVIQREDSTIRPVKPDRMKSTKRIDGIVAALMGMSRAILDQAPRDPYSEGARLMTM